MIFLFIFNDSIVNTVTLIKKNNMKKIMIMFSIIFSITFIGSSVLSDRLIGSDEILMRVIQSLTFAVVMYLINFFITRNAKTQDNIDMAVLKNNQGITDVKELMGKNSGMVLKSESETSLVYSKDTNPLLSFGEIITLDFYTENGVDLMRIESKSMFSLAILDFGVNSSNVKHIHELM